MISIRVRVLILKVRKLNRGFDTEHVLSKRHDFVRVLILKVKAKR